MLPCGMMLVNVYMFRKDGERQTVKRQTETESRGRNPVKSRNPKHIVLLTSWTTFSICLGLNKLHQSATTYTIFSLCDGCSLDVESLIKNMAELFSQLFLLILQNTHCLDVM